MKSIKVEGGNVPGWWIFVLKSVSKLDFTFIEY